MQTPSRKATKLAIIAQVHGRMRSNALILVSAAINVTK
jgi:hypothetical protein